MSGCGFTPGLDGNMATEIFLIKYRLNMNIMWAALKGRVSHCNRDD